MSDIKRFTQEDLLNAFCPKCGQSIDRSKDELPREDKNE